MLAAVVLAVAGGLLCRHLGAKGLATAQLLGQFGQLWLNALRMPLVPLVFCLMTAGVAGIASSAAAGKVARIAVTTFLLLLVLGSVLGVLITVGLTTLWPVAPLHSVPVVASTVAAPPSLLAEFISMVPVNPVASAAEAAMAPLIVFAAIFGIAIVRIQSVWTRLLLDVLNAISAAMLVIIGWVLRIAPLGIFCLLLATVSTVGSQHAAQGLLQYLILAALVPAIGILLMETSGLFSGVGRSNFARAAIPAQTLAATTQSSAACLPALLEAAATLRIPPEIVSAIVPLAVTTFRFGNVMTAMTVGLVGANLFGIHPTPAQIAAAAGIGILTNIGSVGVPGAAVLLAAWGPVFLALGAPLEALTILIAIIAVPDIMITTCNVTADLTATAVIATLLRKRKHAVIIPS